MILNRLNNLFQYSILNNVKSGNQIVDYIMSIAIIYFINYFIKYSDGIKKNFLMGINRLFYGNNYVEIVVEAHTTTIERNGQKLNKILYSKTFQAITYYIKKYKPNDIYSKREPDKNDNVFDFFIPDQSKPFLLEGTKELMCTMQFNEDIYESKEKMQMKRKHTIKIFSTNSDTTITDIENFIESAINEYNIYIENRSDVEQYYFSFINSDEYDGGYELNFSEKRFTTNRTFDTVFFENKLKFLENLSFFLNNKSWYIKKGIPYHLGILLHGHPGCGKTSIIKAILNYTGRNAIVVSLNRVKKCGELEKIFFDTEINKKNIQNDKRIYIFEDIDCISDIVKERTESEIGSDSDFNGLIKKISDITAKEEKKRYKYDDEINLSCLLNIFDGILEMPGRIIILTTNYPEKVDKALLRPGRIDLNVELKKASKSVINEILSYFYDVDIEKIRELTEGQIEGDKYTPAEIINICQNNKIDIYKTIEFLKE